MDESSLPRNASSPPRTPGNHHPEKPNRSRRVPMKNLRSEISIQSVANAFLRRARPVRHADAPAAAPSPHSSRGCALANSLRGHGAFSRNNSVRLVGYWSGSICRCKQLHLLRSRPEWRKAFSMNRARPAFVDGRIMLWRRVTLVLGETVAGVLLVKFAHQTVARHFGNHACRRNRITAPVALHKCGLRIRKPIDLEPVHEHVLRTRLQLVQCKVHGAPRSLPDVDAVDHLDIHDRNGMADLKMTCDDLEKFFALLLVEHFGIVQAAQFGIQTAFEPGVRENHRSGNDWSRQRPAAGFVNTGHQRRASLPKLALESQPIPMHRPRHKSSST